MLNFLLRVVLFFFGLLFALSMAVAAVLLLAVWLVRVAWAKLTGKAVTPWSVMFGHSLDPRRSFDRFRAAGARRPAEPTAAETAAARAQGHETRSPGARLQRGPAEDVTDVRARPVKNGG